MGLEANFIIQLLETERPIFFKLHKNDSFNHV